MVHSDARFEPSTLDRTAPLNDSTFFSDMNFLARPNQSDDDAPLWNPFGKLDEMLGF